MTTIQDVLDLLRTGLPPMQYTESEWLQHKVYEACGMLANRIEEKECYNCNGTGRVKVIVDIECSQCNGTGMVYAEVTK